MTAIWKEDGSDWSLLAPTGFPLEATLHDLIEAAPQTLPLSGEARLTILGREVRLGSAYADLVAVEPTGRVAILEMKLASSTEARWSVVTQVLAYASYLYGLDPEEFEISILQRHLHDRGFDSLSSAVKASDQEGVFDERAFYEGLNDSLTHGRFRLVIVLDRAPEELVRLVGYLETVTDGLLIDLVTVSRYEIDGSQIMVPQRVDPERIRTESATPPVRKASKSYFVEGSNSFVDNIDAASPEHQPTLRKLVSWAQALEREGLARLGTYHGHGNRITLLPRLIPEDVGLITIWNFGGAYISLWRSVFESCAPSSIEAVEQVITPKSIGQGNTVRDISDELLDALTAAYREASRSPALTAASSSIRGNSGCGFVTC